MCGSARSITSPSISSTRRNTPWAAGCCGPKFMVYGLIFDSVLVVDILLVAPGLGGTGGRLGLLVAGQHDVGHAFPRAEEIERAEILGQLDRLVDDALL